MYVVGMRDREWVRAAQVFNVWGELRIRGEHEPHTTWALYTTLSNHCDSCILCGHWQTRWAVHIPARVE